MMWISHDILILRVLLYQGFAVGVCEFVPYTLAIEVPERDRVSTQRGGFPALGY